jgi:hypothetical protein
MQFSPSQCPAQENPRTPHSANRLPAN